MNSERLIQRMRRLIETRSRLVLGFLVVATGLLVSVSTLGIKWNQGTGPIVIPNPQIDPVVEIKGEKTKDVIVTTNLSHKKITQNNQEEIYMEIKITAPKGEKTSIETPMDFVVVLDQSSSMDSPKKFPMAKKALISLVKRLGKEDRISIVGFSSGASVLKPLEFMTDANKASTIQQIQSWYPSGSTNFQAALERTNGVVEKGNEKRASRVLFLSDGEITAGSQDSKFLASLVKQITDKNAVMSTIGMGLKFNEKSLAHLADHGMGQYHFLESLEQLAQIFENDIKMASQLYANQSEVRIKLGEGVRIVDAGGYPIEGNGHNVVIPTGQLLSGKSKSFFLTLKASPQNLGTKDIAKIDFTYKKDSKSYVAEISKPLHQVAVLEQSRVEEVKKAINKDVYKKSWLSNNVGRIQKKVASLIKAGRGAEAKKELSEFKGKMDSAAQYGGFRYEGSGAAQQVDELEDISSSNLSGVERDRQAKKIHKRSMEAQRVSN